MSRNRFLILLGACLLSASAAWADDVGLIDCSSHSEGAQVFAKPRRTPELVASVPCGERFTILVYGFVFSRIQTGDGKVGYVYSNLIAVDRAGAPAQKPPSAQVVTASEKVAIRTAPVAQPAPSVPAQSAPAPVAPAPAPVVAPPAPISSAPVSHAAISNAPQTNVTVAQPDPPAPAQLQPVLAQPAPVLASEPASSFSVSAPASPAPIANAPEPSAPAAQPDPPAQPQPEPAPAQPAAAPIQPVNDRATWEKPNPGGVRREPLIEVFGGYAFARLDGGGGTATNLNGALGSFGWNFKPWLQIVADSSYSVVTVGTTKNVLYGNHFGPRYFHRGRNRWGATPFVEGLIGGSRADTTISGVGGYTTSANCLSYKVGGGLDLHPSRHWEIRLFDVDYYRTSFGTNVQQNNYWVSTGIILHLFGGRSDY